jgi:hypothetical protein
MRFLPAVEMTRHPRVLAVEVVGGGFAAAYHLYKHLTVCHPERPPE